MRVTYNGKHATVAVKLGDRFVTCDRGGSVDVTAADAKILAGLPGWTKTPSSEEE